MIPKCDNNKVNEVRPITCLSNLYKIMTKVITINLQYFVEVNNILSINQLGSVKQCQGAK